MINEVGGGEASAAAEDVRPLAGLRVVELAVWVAAPVAASLLGSLGADVIKIENARGGDPSRGGSGAVTAESARQDGFMWRVCNRNKRVITLDLGHEAALPIFHDLLRKADVFVTNLQSEALARFQADEAAVRALNAVIIYGRASGLGERGPWADTPHMDSTGSSYAGLPFTYTDTADDPYLPEGWYHDILTGSMIALGLLAALIERGRNGLGQYVGGSLLQTGLWMGGLNLARAAEGSAPARPRSQLNPRSATMNWYRCGDGRWITIAGSGPRMWPPFKVALGLESLADDARFASYNAMLTHSAELVELLNLHFATAPATYWIARLRTHGVLVAPINHLPDLLSDAQVAANDYLTTLDDGTRTATMPFDLRGHRPATRPGPAYGADTDAVLAELGLDEAAVLALRVGGAVW